MPSHIPLAAADRKRLATLAARAALSGVTLHHMEGDFVPHLFVCSRWALTREFTDLDAVERWLDLVGGRRAAEGVPPT
ncbi:hypothetical protein [Variovorax guangxiensis]|uniref:hypothetical protein n=1 Tax=Variovorax guangxiensis TaxID=1775474 RepID=UPI00285A029F|nr:hypothetical protein [Variovorax guangxiensis]MDR6857229.1 hypothetical protein [Variovorax guangxiensis]